jgi:hypothetical protein
MEKQSNNPDATLDAKRQLVQILVNAGVLGLGTGAAYTGMRHMLSPLKKPLPAIDAGSQLYDPIETVRSEVDSLPQMKSAAGGWTDMIAKNIPDFFTPMTGANSKNNWSVLGLGIPLAAASTYAGATGLSGLLKAYQDRQKSLELSDAEREYHRAIKKQFETAMMDKNALDAAYDNYVNVKQAQAPQPPQPPQYQKSELLYNTIPNVMGSVGEAAGNLSGAFMQGVGRAGAQAYQNPFVNIGTGAYVGGLGLMGLLGAYLGNKYNNKRQQDKVMERAILERRRARGLVQPLYAVPGSHDDEE